MTMSLTSEERKELAEFCGDHIELNEIRCPIANPENKVYIYNSKRKVNAEWGPCFLESPQWQIQAVLDAVREKGLGNVFLQKLWDELDTYGVEPTDETTRGMLVVSAPPEAICQAVLEVIDNES